MNYSSAEMMVVTAARLLRECLFVVPHVFSETVLNDLRLTPSGK